MSPTSANGNLCDGSNWAIHEDHLVADEAGLKNLIRACEEALENGEFQGDGLGEFTGVKKLETKWFEEPEDESGSSFCGFVVCAALLLFLFFAVVGVYRVYDLTFS